ncbi:hypothetical protein N8Z26_02355 [Burkholderiales bacterium]|nr:hypothetical protein [Burkholderiales bacterium]
MTTEQTLSSKFTLSHAITLSLVMVVNMPTLACSSEWSPVLILENGDEILWKLNQVVEPKNRFLMNELRDLNKTHDGIKSFVTQFEIDCERLRIREISYDYYSQPGASELIKNVNIAPNKQRWAYAEWNEYVKFMTDYFCE